MNVKASNSCRTATEAGLLYHPFCPRVPVYTQRIGVRASLSMHSYTDQLFNTQGLGNFRGLSFICSKLNKRYAWT